MRSFGLVLMPTTWWDERAILDIPMSSLLFKQSRIEELEDVINSGEERTRNFRHVKKSRVCWLYPKQKKTQKKPPPRKKHPKYPPI